MMVQVYLDQGCRNKRHRAAQCKKRPMLERCQWKLSKTNEDSGNARVLPEALVRAPGINPA